MRPPSLLCREHAAAADDRGPGLKEAGVKWLLEVAGYTGGLGRKPCLSGRVQPLDCS